MRTPRVPTVFLLAPVLALVLAACASGSAKSSPTTAAPSSASTSSTTAKLAGPAAFVPKQVDWQACGSTDCATLDVPLDYKNPAGEKIPLNLVRVRASGNRIGSMLVNPGGPGVPGTDFARDVAQNLPESIASRFDIIGWDPRGTGQSRPVDCGAKIDYLFAPDTAPESPAELHQLEAASKRFADACAARSGGLLAHISTQDSARDMDSIRQAVGDPKLTYVGFSYGTYLGSLYAQLFPQNVRALVLDGAVDPAIPADRSAIVQAKGFEQSFDRFLRTCAGDSSCAIHNGGDPRAAFDELRARIERSPMQGSDGRVLGPTQLDIAIASPLYEGASADRRLAGELRSAIRGDPDPALDEFSAYMDRSPDGSYSSQWPAFLAISCLDGPDLNVAQTEAAQRAAAQESPNFGSSNVGLGYACAYWHEPPVNRTATAVRAPSAPPIVVVGTTGDPATPYEEAVGLSHELGSGRLVTVDGTSHTSLLNANPCLDEIAERYLVDLQPPAPDTRCAA